MTPLNAATDLFNNSFPEHTLNTPLGFSNNNNENMNISRLVHVWNTTSTNTISNTTKLQYNHAYQDRKSKSNSP